MFMSVEMMLNAVNLTLITYSRFLQNVDGQVFVLLVIAVAAAEVAVGLSIVVALYRHKETTDVDEIDLLKASNDDYADYVWLILLCPLVGCWSPHFSAAGWAGAWWRFWPACSGASFVRQCWCLSPCWACPLKTNRRQRRERIIPLFTWIVSANSWSSLASFWTALHPHGAGGHRREHPDPHLFRRLHEGRGIPQPLLYLAEPVCVHDAGAVLSDNFVAMYLGWEGVGCARTS